MNTAVNLFIPSKDLSLVTVDKDYTSTLTWTLNGNDTEAKAATPLVAK